MNSVYPDLPTFRELALKGNLVPVYTELSADLDTPVSVYLKLRGTGSPSFVLESAERGERLGRYSFIGAGGMAQLVVTEGEARLTTAEGTRVEPLGGASGKDPLHLLEELLQPYQAVPLAQLPPLSGGAIGYLAYEAARYFEPVPVPEADELGLPEAFFVLSHVLIAFDHLRHKIQAIVNAPIGDHPEEAYRRAVAQLEELCHILARPAPSAPRPSRLRPRASARLVSNFPRPRFLRMVRAARDYILSGEAIQIVLSQRFRRKTRASPFDIYRALRRINPSPYMFFLDFGDFQLIGSSPEMLVRLRGRKAETHPIAGTRPRGHTPEEDRVLSEELLLDPKERAEHVMLVDLARNDLGRVCRSGTVQVTELMGVEKYSHVIHLVSTVEGELREGATAFDLLRATFPAGTVSGAPKIRAMELIAELEETRRGPYAGAVGYFSFDGSSDTCITIRTVVMKGDVVYLQAGAGIVADSKADREHRETLSKIRALEEAVREAEGETGGA